jgi:hypothetical protein
MANLWFLPPSWPARGFQPHIATFRRSFPLVLTGSPRNHAARLERLAALANVARHGISNTKPTAEAVAIEASQANKTGVGDPA